MPERVKGKTLLFILVILGTAPLYFWSALDGARLLTERDLSVFFIPPRVFWTEALRAGEFPLWNPYSYAGHPFFATLQPGVLYPLNVLLLLLPFDLAFNWSVAAHYGLAGCFTYALLRELRASSSGALGGALVFMLSGYLFSVHNVMSTLFSAAWAPLAIATHLRAQRYGSPAYAAACGLIMCVMFLGGGVETVGATFILLSIISVHPPVLLSDWHRGPGVLTRSGLFAITLLVFLGLSAIQLFPFIELALQSTRAGGLSFSEATTWSFAARDFVQLLLPDPYWYGSSTEKYWANQNWLKTVYLGPVPFILAGFYFLRRGFRAAAFALTLALFVVLSMGANTPVYRYIYEYIPLVDKIRYPVKFMFAAFVLMAVAAGLGLDSLKEALKKGERGAARLILAALSSAAIAAVLLGGLDFFEPAIKERLTIAGFDYPAYNAASINIFNAKRALIIFMLAACALYAAMKARSGAVAAALLIPMLWADLFFAHSGYYQTTDTAEYHSRSPVLEFVSRDNSGLFRVYTTPRTAKGPSPAAGVDAGLFDAEKDKVSGFSLEHRVFDAGGVEVMKRADYSALLELVARQDGPDSTSLLRMLNVKYLVSAPSIRSDRWARVDFPGLDREDGIKLYENLEFLPRHYMVYDYRVLSRLEEIIETLLDKDFDPGSTVLLEKRPFGLEKQAPGLSSVEVSSYSNNSSELRVRTDRGGVLVASEGWYPGWKAYVDGREAEVLKANLVLRAVALNAGEHTVKFVYSPASFKAGALVSASTLILSAACFAYFAWRDRR